MSYGFRFVIPFYMFSCLSFFGVAVDCLAVGEVLKKSFLLQWFISGSAGLFGCVIFWLRDRCC